MICKRSETTQPRTRAGIRTRVVELAGVVGGALVALTSVLGCSMEADFQCQLDSDCVLKEVQGRCEPIGYCSFPDGSCDSSWRYGVHAPPMVAGVCVSPEDAFEGSSGGAVTGGDASSMGEPETSDTFASTGVDNTQGGSSGWDDGSTGDDPPEPMLCGNGDLDPGEACDDANALNADGCNNDCTVTGALVWSQTLGGAAGQVEDFFGVAVGPDERAYVTGALWQSAEHSDLWIQEFGADAMAGWDVVLEGTGQGSGAGRSLVFEDDALYAAGKLSVAGLDDEWWVGQLAVDGTQGWSTTSGAAGVAEDAARSIVANPSGGLYVTGRTQHAATSMDLVVRHYDNGVEAAVASHDGLVHGSDGGRAVAVDPMGAIVVAGYETGASGGIGGDLDGWVAKFNAAGQRVWAQSVVGPAGGDELASGVVVDDLGAVYAAGFETLAAGNTIGWVRKWASDGTQGWTHTWDGGMRGAYVSFLALAIDSSGHIVVVGSEDTDVKRGIIEKLDLSGMLLWRQTFGDPVEGDKRFRSVAVGPGDHIWAAGRIDLGAEQDGFDGWLVRVAP